jgi:hypothetical protein
MAEAADTHAFDHPPAEVQRYFDAKAIKPSFDWRDFSFDEHATAFTVAKSAGYDILGDVKQALSKAIRERQDYAEFARGLEPTLKAKGWWGKARQVDPLTGEERIVQLGSPRRLQTIYWANVNSAYAAGEWERIERTKRVLPYLQYLHTTAEHPRPQHLAWVGTILPVGDAWWATHYPPNGWGCQCRVRQLSDAEAERFGYVADDPDEPANFGTKAFVNKRTGEVVDVPVGIDPGWGQNPGLMRTENAAKFISGRIDAMSEEARAAAIADLADSWLMKRIASGTIPFDRTSRDPAVISRGRIAVPFAALPADLASAVGGEARAVMLSVADATKQNAVRTDKMGATSIRPADYAVVQTLIDRGLALVEAERTLVLIGEVEGLFWQAAIRRAESAPGELYLKSLHRSEAHKIAALRRRGRVAREAK